MTEVRAGERPSPPHGPELCRFMADPSLPVASHQAHFIHLHTLLALRYSSLLLFFFLSLFIHARSLLRHAGSLIAAHKLS